MRIQLPKDVGGSIRFDPPQLALVTSPTCSVRSPAGAELTTPSVSTNGEIGTLAAAAAAGDSSVTLSATTNLAVRRRYVLRATNGDREWVRVRAFNSSTKVVTLYERLVGTYASGSAFIDNRLTLTVSTGAAATIDEGYEARLTYVADGVTYRPIVQFDVVRAAWPEQLVSTNMLREYAPNVFVREYEAPDAEGTDYADLLEQATERVITDIRSAGRDPSRFRSFDDFRRPVKEACLLHLALQGDNLPSAYTNSPGEWLATRRSEYADAMTQALSVARDYDVDQDGTVDEGERAVRMASPRIRR